MAEEVIKIEQLKHFKDKYDEQVGGQLAQVNTQLDTKLDKVDPTGTGSFSLNRASGSTIGKCSVAVGGTTVATGEYSHAEGISTIASGNTSHAEGSGTRASGYSSHAEGYQCQASGEFSHAEGSGIIAQRKSQHVSGEYNIADTSGTKTTRGDYVEIVGNGTANDTRSNARTVDWNGNERLKGTLYINCNADSTGGSQVVSQADIGTAAQLYYTWDADTGTLNFFTTNPNS